VDIEKFIVLPEKYIFDYKLTGNQIKVLCFFIKYNNMYEKLFFSIDYISNNLSLSKRTVQKILMKFQKYKFISWIKRSNNSNLYTVHIAKGGQTKSKNCSLINTYNNNNKEDDNKKYVNINIIQNSLKQVSKRTNIFYRSKVNQNQKIGPRALLEKKAWSMISEMDETRRRILMDGFQNDNAKWEDFLNRIKQHKFVFYKNGKRAIKGGGFKKDKFKS
jgi:hypothetical protein